MHAVLIVEDDELFATQLAGFLEKRGYQVSVEDDGNRAVSRVLAAPPDAVILDGNLPRKDGFSVCREIRDQYSGAILMLTARDDDFDRVLGLELGADDYLIKPVEPRVVEAHLKACLRRFETRPMQEPAELRYGKFSINGSERVVHLDGKELVFTTAEFELLWMLAKRAGSILSRDEIMAGARGLPHDGLDRSIDMRVSRLRKRLGDDPDNPRRIKTVRGKGYLFSRNDWY